MEKFTKKLLKVLVEETKCGIQHNGCPCRTCFFDLCERLGLDNERAGQFWRVVLILRGDYKEDEVKKCENYEKEMSSK